MNLYNHYLRIKTETLPEATGIEAVLNNPSITDEVKKSVTDFITVLGYKVAELADKVTIFPPKSSALVDTWEVRSESKKLLALQDLDAVVRRYEGTSLLESGYTDYDLSEILESAAYSSLYATERKIAVKEAYIRWIISKRNGIEGRATLLSDIANKAKEEASFEI